MIHEQRVSTALGGQCSPAKLEAALRHPPRYLPVRLLQAYKVIFKLQGVLISFEVQCALKALATRQPNEHPPRGEVNGIPILLRDGYVAIDPLGENCLLPVCGVIHFAFCHVVDLSVFGPGD